MKRLHTYSQNFLRSPNLVKELLGHSKIKKNDTVLDIGAGSGVITSVLAARVSKVIAIEAEQKTAEVLKRNTAKYKNVEVVNKDFLKFDLPKEPYSIFANIPFHLSSPIINRLIDTEKSPEKTYLILQKQFARKLVASDNRFFTGQLGMLLGAKYDVKIRKPLRKTDFWPHPAVDTVFIEIKLRDQPRINESDLQNYKKMTIDCFSDPKNYRKLPLSKIGISPELKPSMLNIDQWVSLFKESNWK